MINRVERNSFYSDMGFRLKQIRQAKQISQNELANSLGVVSQTIQKYESGEVRILPEVIQKCAALFKVPVGYFYGEEHANRRFSRVSLMIATEVMRLPSNDVQKNLYNLVKSMNDYSGKDKS